MLDEATALRFWAKVGPPGPTGCREWTACRVNGYGRFGVSRKPKLAHRVAWELVNGPIPPGYDVCHRCDNPPCCEDSHLFVGTRAENLADMAAKGRRADRRGEANPKAKLTAIQVAAIRSRYAAGGSTQRGLAREFGVSKVTVWSIVHSITWRAS